MKRMRTALITLAFAALFGIVLTVFFQDRLTPPPTSSASEDVSADTMHIYDLNDTADWNGYLTFQIENASYSKTVPQGFTAEDIMGLSMISADAQGTLIEHTYVDITVHVTCTQLFPALFGHDAPEDGERVPVPLAFADQRVSVYHQKQERVTASGELRAYACLSDGYEIDHHGTAELDVGDSIRVRLIFIVKDTSLNDTETAILFTPQYGIFSAAHLRRLEYTQPHILLKGETL